jgi:hypothetical protein
MRFIINVFFNCIFWLILFPIALFFAGFSIILNIIIGLLIDMQEACAQIVGILFGVNDEDEDDEDVDQEDVE